MTINKLLENCPERLNGFENILQHQKYICVASYECEYKFESEKIKYCLYDLFIQYEKKEANK